jgi:hypothetical protein
MQAPSAGRMSVTASMSNSSCSISSSSPSLSVSPVCWQTASWRRRHKVASHNGVITAKKTSHVRLNTKNTNKPTIWGTTIFFILIMHWYAGLLLLHQNYKSHFYLLCRRSNRRHSNKA